MHCCECKRKKKSYQLRAVVQHQNGVIDFCCRACWHLHAYNDFMHEKW